ncbi:hypothetical protein FD755_006098, partial [Muntiacus reevesi]
VANQYSVLFRQEHTHDDAIWSSHQPSVLSVDFSHTLPIAATHSLDAHILWQLEKSKQIKSVDAGPVDAWTLAFSPDSQYLGKEFIRKKEYSLDTRGKFILSIAYCPDGKFLASRAIGGIISIFDITTGKLLHMPEGHGMSIRSLTFSWIHRSFVKVWDDGMRTCVHTFFDHQDQVWGVKYNGNGSKIVSVRETTRKFTSMIV